MNAKLAWAKQHFKAVDDEIAAWLQGNPHSLTFERNEDFTKHWLRVSLNGEPPDFTRWSLMIGDCVTNLRDTLDHLVFAIASLPSSPRPEKRSMAAFLIASRPEDFKEWSRSKLASVPDPIRNAILGFQPFNRPHSLLPPLLKVLGNLANGNKHKLLGVVLTTPRLIDVEFISYSGIKQNATFNIYKHDLRDGSPLCIFQLPEPDPTVKLNAKSKVSLEVAIKHEALKGNTAFDCDRTDYRILLQLLFDEVNAVITELTKNV